MIVSGTALPLAVFFLLRSWTRTWAERIQVIAEDFRQIEGRDENEQTIF